MNKKQALELKIKTLKGEIEYKTSVVSQLMTKQVAIDKEMAALEHDIAKLELKVLNIRAELEKIR